MKTSARIYLTMVLAVILIAIYSYLPLMLNAHDDMIVLLGFILIPVPAICFGLALYNIWKPFFRNKKQENNNINQN